MNERINTKISRALPYLIGLLLMIATIIRGAYVSFAWCDELSFLDSAVTLLRTGHWHSEVFYLVNHPVYPIIAALVTSVFGHTHEVVIGLGSVGAYLAMSALLFFLARRKILTGLLPRILFVCLFWLGAHFSGIITNGRPDTMVLLFTVLLLNRMYPEEGRKVNLALVVLHAFLLMLFAVYTLPLMALLSFLGVLHRSERLAAFKRTVAIVTGSILGWFAIASFYAWHHEIVRFLGFYAAFNSITGERYGTFAERVVNGFLFDRWALALLAGAAAIVLVTRQKVGRLQVGYFLFVALIPLLMVLCGRYQSYYSWLYYVPACVLFAAALDRCKPWISLIPIAAVLALSVGRFQLSPAQLERKARAEAAYRFVEENAQHFTGGVNVLVADDTVGDDDFYYPLLQRPVKLWFRGKVALSELPDAKKFEVGLALFVHDANKRDEILRRLLKYQNVMPYLPPPGGLVVFVSNANRDEVRPLIEKADYALTPVADDGERSLFRLSQKL